MRLILTALACVALMVPRLALAAEATPAPPTWGDAHAALITVVISAIGIVGSILLALRPLIVSLATKFVEDATSARVERLNEALDTELAAGASPRAAAEGAARKLPQTVKRSNKSIDQLEDEASVRALAKRPRGRL